MDAIYSFFANFNTIVVLLTIVCFTFYWYFTVPRDIPPGPRGLPLIGSLQLLVTATPGKALTKLTEKYGPIFSFYAGNKLTIVLNSYEAIKEAFVKQADIFSGRPNQFSFNISEAEKYNIVTSDGQIWKEQRHFALKVLKELGVGKLSIEPQILDEIQHFLEELKLLGGKETDFRELLSLSFSNVICILLFGKRYDYDDLWFISAKRFTDEMAITSSSITLFEFFPWLRYIPGIAKLLKQDNLVQSLNNLKASYFLMISEKRKRHIDGYWNNYTSAYIEEQNQKKAKGKYDETFSDVALEQNMRMLLVVGTETTASSLQWAILLMMLHPEIQSQAQQEIDKVFGSDHLPSWNERHRTPYVEAVIQEIQRFATIIQLNVPHRNTEECKVLGHKIPKDSYIVSNLWAVHNDPKLWKEPEIFRPERFLNGKGEVIKSEHLVTFSIGKRQCLGIELARMELYLFFTSMLQKFTFKPSEGAIPSLQPRLTIACVPKYFKSRAIPRTAA